MEVLIVDDVRSIRTTMEAILSKAGVEDVIEAATGKQALSLIADKVPDLVFLDIQLPDMSGLEVLAEIKRKHPQLIVVVVTGFEEAAVVQKIVQLGAYQYIVKPLQFEAIEQIVMTVRRRLR